MEVVPISRLGAHCGNHNPSQTTLGTVYIAACKKITMGAAGNKKLALCREVAPQPLFD